MLLKILKEHCNYFLKTCFNSKKSLFGKVQVKSATLCVINIFQKNPINS